VVDHTTFWCDHHFSMVWSLLMFFPDEANLQWWFYFKLRGPDWRIHGGAEDTKLSTNKQHTLSKLNQTKQIGKPVFMEIYISPTGIKFAPWGFASLLTTDVPCCLQRADPPALDRGPKSWSCTTVRLFWRSFGELRGFWDGCSKTTEIFPSSTDNHTNR